MPQDIDQSSLRALLDALDPDDSEAGQKYENLRLRLIRFFRWNSCLRAEEMADTALDRLAAKIRDVSEPIEDPVKYITGIARMLMHEYRASELRERKMLTHFSWLLASPRPPPPEVAEEEREGALSRCLEALPRENRRLLERYYSGDAGERIRDRKALADEIGVEVNALRNRALRLRRQLELCISRCLARVGGRDGLPLSLTDKRERKVR
jgi:DNA-directed RNA polymerase specialized sigma24 family protein